MGRRLRYLVLLVALIITGPGLWYFLDVLQRGPTSGNVPMIVPALGLYGIWCGAVWLLRPRTGEHVELGCFLLLGSALAMALLGWGATYLPLPQDNRSIEKTGLLLTAYFPWLLLQYAVFILVWRRMLTA